LIKSLTSSSVEDTLLKAYAFSIFSSVKSSGEIEPVLILYAIELTTLWDDS